ncbi:MAG TPA: hypothetical protein VKV16_07765 [Solirubrobacteraceae bacterium]|nr:hypothetical protein [Solirubrobacteraceae bacterium]
MSLLAPETARGCPCCGARLEREAPTRWRCACGHEVETCAPTAATVAEIARHDARVAIAGLETDVAGLGRVTSILDASASTGAFVAAARRAGIVAFGIEAVAARREAAVALYGVELDDGALERHALRLRSVDVVVHRRLGEVLDPGGLLGLIGRSIGPRTRALLEVPWRGASDAPPGVGEVLHRFDAAGVERALWRAGLVPIDLHVRDDGALVAAATRR